MRIREAKLLFDARLFGGSYYLAGYSVECALKAIIARRTRRYDFPDRTLVNQIYTHDLSQLLIAARVRSSQNIAIPDGSDLERNWKRAAEWREGSRYILNTSEQDAAGLFHACADRKDGVLSWLKNFW